MAQSPTQLDPFFHEGGDISTDPTWVTVFGFSPAATSFILRHFRQYGVILHHIADQNGGNWMHIHYKTKLSARKAFSKNGKVFL